MKSITLSLKAFFAAGRIGLVIFLMAGAVFFAAFSQVSDPFEAAIERMEVLNALEGDIRLNLSEMQVQEAQFIFALAYGLPARDAEESAARADEAITARLEALETEGRLSGEVHEYSSDLSALLEEFDQLRADHRDIYEETLFAIEDGDDELVFDLLDELEENNLALHQTLQAMVLEVEHNRLAALEAFPGDMTGSILMVAVAFLASLLLALAGYQAIAGAVRPLRRMGNLIREIGGNLYEPGEADHLLRLGGSAGGLARALDELARAEDQRIEDEKEEIAQLREALQESRRRRLKLFRGTGEGGGSHE